MTVKQLIAELRKFPPGTEVVFSLHSEYMDVEQVETIEGFRNGGYVSRVYRVEDEPTSKTFIFLS